MVVLKISFLMAFAFSFANASEICPAPNSSTKNFTDLSCIQDKIVPKCIEVGSNFESKDSPESVIEKLTKDLSDEEMYTRLIFAESLASQCIDGSNVDSVKSKAISEGIAWVLKNRAQSGKEKQYGSGRGIITKAQQFRSSTGSCDVAKRVEFLCPEKAGAQWQKVWANASEALQKTNGEKNPLPKVYQYFFDGHFDKSVNCAKWKGVQPAWAKPDLQSEMPGIPKADGCIKFYK
jgi:hypothetical protein